ncbi:hypothetical protein V8N76_004004 [Salmonella enterica]
MNFIIKTLTGKFKTNAVSLVFGFFIVETYSQTITCTQPDDPWSSINTPIELKPSGVTITVGAKIPDFTVLYTQNNVTLGKNLTACDSSIFLYETIVDLGVLPVKTIASDKIYPTDVSGIGISIYSQDTNTSLLVYPGMVMNGWLGTHIGDTMITTIKLWKIPGNIPMTSGSLSVNGPTVAQLLNNTPLTFVSSEGHTDRIHADARYYLASSRQLHATLIFKPGTCEIQGGAVTVKMGEHPGINNKNSSWKDASFRLICPDAHGYGGISAMNNAGESPFGPGHSASVTSNNSNQNGRVRVAIEPYTAIVDAGRAIIALDGTGATGYGIQLAWGDYSSQTDGDPTKPVRFGIGNAIYASELNTNFRSTPTPIDGNAFIGGDNTFHMAARYIRTSGDIKPGQAIASVEVIANYE